MLPAAWCLAYDSTCSRTSAGRVISALLLAVRKARAGPVLRANVNGDDIPVGGLLDVAPAGVPSQVAGGQPLAPDVVQRAAEAGSALDDDVTVGRLLGKDTEGREPLPRHILQLLGRAEAGDRELGAVEVVPDGCDVGAAVRADGGQSGDVWLAEEGLDVCGDDGWHIHSWGRERPHSIAWPKGASNVYVAGQRHAIMALNHPLATGGRA